MVTLAACVVIIGVWLLLGAVLVGLGRGTRKLAGGDVSVWTFGDFWTGLAVVVSLAFVWHQFWRIDSVIWVVVVPIAVAGLVAAPRKMPRFGWRTLPWVAVALLIGLYVADKALQPVGAYDSALYQLPMLDWLHTYRAVPGLANFHGRFGFNTGSLMFDAVVGAFVPASIAAHFASSLLVAALSVEILTVVRTLARRGLTSAQYAPGILFLLALPSLAYPLHDSAQISSPSPDLPAIVVSLAAALYCGRVVSAHKVQVNDFLPAVALLVFLPVVRVQFSIFTFVAVAAVAVTVAKRGLAILWTRRLVAWSGGLVILILGSWTAHGYVLSGYPVFPAQFLGLPFSWKVPSNYTSGEAAVIKLWGRTPAGNPATTLHGYSWLPGWAARTAAYPDVPGMVLLCGVGFSALIGFAIYRLVRRRVLPQWRWVTPVLSALATGFCCVWVVHAVHLVMSPTHKPLRLLSVAAAAALAVAVGAGLLAGRSLIKADERLGNVLPAAVLGLAAGATAVGWFLLAPDPRFAIAALWLTAALPAGVALTWLWARRKAAAAVLLVAALATSGYYPLHQLQLKHMLATTHAISGGKWGMPTAQVGQVRQAPAGVDGTLVNVPKIADVCQADTLPCTPDPTRPWTLRVPGRMSGGFQMTRDLAKDGLPSS